MRNCRKSEHLCHPLYGGGKSRALFDGVVEGKRGAQRAYDAKAFHERLGAVVTRTQGKSQLVEQHAHVVGVNVADEKRDDAAFLRGGPVNAYAVAFFQQPAWGLL